LTHFFNFLFLTLLIRSGIEIIRGHPKFYWRDDALSPGNAVHRDIGSISSSDVQSLSTSARDKAVGEMICSIIILLMPAFEIRLKFAD